MASCVSLYPLFFSSPSLCMDIFLPFSPSSLSLSHLDSTIVVVLESGENTGVDVTNNVEAYIDCSILGMTESSGTTEVFFFQEMEFIAPLADP